MGCILSFIQYKNIVKAKHYTLDLYFGSLNAIHGQKKLRLIKSSFYVMSLFYCKVSWSSQSVSAVQIAKAKWLWDFQLSQRD